jgi:uncharacterized protein
MQKNKLLCSKLPGIISAYSPKKTIMFFIAIFLSFSVFAQVKYQGFVTDYAEVITVEDKVIMEAIAQEVKEKSGAEIALLTVKSIEPYSSMEEFSIKTAQSWGIGQKGKDNGIFIALAVNIGIVKIETGYGLEGALPDSLAGRIMDNYMLPYFKNGNYSKGLKTGYTAIASVVAREYNFTIDNRGVALPNQDKILAKNEPDLFWLFIIIVILFFVFGKSRILPISFLGSIPFGGGFGSIGYTRGGFSGGFKGSGFGGFSGGSFGGGGAIRRF